MDTSGGDKKGAGVETLNCAGCGSILSIVVALHAVAIDCHAKHMLLSLKNDLGIDLEFVVANQLLLNARVVRSLLGTTVSVTIAIFFFDS